MVSTAQSLQRRSAVAGDPVMVLATIGRIPLLTPAEEIELGNQVQAMMELTEDGSKTFDDSALTTQQRRLIRIGRRAKRKNDEGQPSACCQRREEISGQRS